MRPVSIAGVCGSVLSLGVTALYAAIILSEGNDPIEQWGPWAAGFFAIGLVGILASFVANRRRRRLAFLICAFASLVIGAVAIFSVGALLFIAGLLFAAAASSASGAD
jgi:uncharacterized membrane protein